MGISDLPDCKNIIKQTRTRVNMTKKIIEHLGQSIKTSVEFDLLPHEFVEDIRKQFYHKPTYEEVDNEIAKLTKGEKFQRRLVLDYYIRDELFNNKMLGNKWTVNEFMNSDELVSMAYAFIKQKTKFFTSESIYTVFNQYFRASNMSVVKRLSNFPFNTAVKVIKDYNFNNNYFDYSSGWSIRMMASVFNKVNYHSVDTNDKLVESLLNLKEHVSRHNSELTIDLKCQPSQDYIPEYKNKMGLCFSSPPYFDLELYNGSLTSTTTHSKYEDWLTGYLHKTIDNCFDYIVDGGYFIINIKDTKKRKMLTDSELYLNKKFKYVERLELKNSKLYSNVNEDIAVFRKV